jgi:hypothetical protein
MPRAPTPEYLDEPEKDLADLLDKAAQILARGANPGDSFVIMWYSGGDWNYAATVDPRDTPKFLRAAANDMEDDLKKTLN